MQPGCRRREALEDELADMARRGLRESSVKKVLSSVKLLEKVDVATTHSAARGLVPHQQGPKGQRQGGQGPSKGMGKLGGRPTSRYCCRDARRVGDRRTHIHILCALPPGHRGRHRAGRGPAAHLQWDKVQS